MSLQSLIVNCHFTGLSVSERQKPGLIWPFTTWVSQMQFRYTPWRHNCTLKESNVSFLLTPPPCMSLLSHSWLFIQVIRVDVTNVKLPDDLTCLWNEEAQVRATSNIRRIGKDDSDAVRSFVAAAIGARGYNNFTIRHSRRALRCWNTKSSSTAINSWLKHTFSVELYKSEDHSGPWPDLSLTLEVSHRCICISVWQMRIWESHEVTLKACMWSRYPRIDSWILPLNLSLPNTILLNVVV